MSKPRRLLNLKKTLLRLYRAFIGASEKIDVFAVYDVTHRVVPHLTVKTKELIKNTYNVHEVVDGKKKLVIDGISICLDHKPVHADIMEFADQLNKTKNLRGLCSRMMCRRDSRGKYYLYCATMVEKELPRR